jgi:hypothetical protein
MVLTVGSLQRVGRQRLPSKDAELPDLCVIRRPPAGLRLNLRMREWEWRMKKKLASNSVFQIERSNLGDALEEESADSNLTSDELSCLPPCFCPCFVWPCLTFLSILACAVLPLCYRCHHPKSRFRSCFWLCLMPLLLLPDFNLYTVLFYFVFHTIIMFMYIKKLIYWLFVQGVFIIRIL